MMSLVCRIRHHTTKQIIVSRVSIKRYHILLRLTYFLAMMFPYLFSVAAKIGALLLRWKFKESEKPYSGYGIINDYHY